MTKLVIQIPCYNEEATLPETLAGLPREVPGVDEVEMLVVDDGSEDRTVAVAREHGADHVHELGTHRGLARAFEAGLRAAVARGADVVVNTDADNQYRSDDIPKLVAPILEGDADIVVGDRDPGSLPHFSWIKQRLQRLGSWMMRRLSGTSVADSTSGFRAYSREAALRLNVVTDFTYTLETLIQAGKRRLEVVDVPVRARDTSRTSRLAPTMGRYLTQASKAMARAYALYEPLRVFTILGAVLMAAGVVLGLRFLYFYLFVDGGTGHVQSLILAAILSIVGFQTLCLGIVADLLAGNRKLSEEVLYRLRRSDVGTAEEEDRTGEPRRMEGGSEDAASRVEVGSGGERTR